MPAPSDGLSAVITFTLPAERLDHDPEIYLTYYKDQQRPNEKIRVAVNDLRPELEDPSSPLPAAQLATRGYAAYRKPTELLPEIHTTEGVKLYLDECARYECSFLNVGIGF
jgi:hypothetical protein